MIAAGLMAGLLLGSLYCARSAWRVVVACGAIGAPLAVALAMLLSGRPESRGSAVPFAILGLLAGLLLGSGAVSLRRRPFAK
jgi:uncharacterized membrane protein YgaE (UPF0421/DUF939 family)